VPHLFLTLGSIKQRNTLHTCATILSIDDVNPNLLYISIQNQLTIKISPNDRVFVTTISTLGATGLGTVRRVLHPHTNASYNLHEHFTDLVYLVELDSTETSRKIPAGALT